MTEEDLGPTAEEIFEFIDNAMDLLELLADRKLPKYLEEKIQDLLLDGSEMCDYFDHVLH